MHYKHACMHACNCTNQAGVILNKTVRAEHHGLSSYPGPLTPAHLVDAAFDKVQRQCFHDQELHTISAQLSACGNS